MDENPPDRRFRPHEHLRRPADFRRVYDRRRSVSDDRLIVYAADNHLPFNRIGLSVSRKVGGAVERNRVRRRLREIVRHAAGLSRGHDYVLIGRRAALSLPFEQINQDFQRALRRVPG